MIEFYSKLFCKLSIDIMLIYHKKISQMIMKKFRIDWDVIHELEVQLVRLMKQKPLLYRLLLAVVCRHGLIIMFMYLLIIWVKIYLTGV